MSQYKDIPKDELDVVSKSILSFVTFLDESLGADEWTSTQVAVVSGSIFLVMFYTIHSYRGVEWYALLHAILTGWGSLVCVYLDLYASETLTGIPGMYFIIYRMICLSTISIPFLSKANYLKKPNSMMNLNL